MKIDLIRLSEGGSQLGSNESGTRICTHREDRAPVRIGSVRHLSLTEEPSHLVFVAADDIIICFGYSFQRHVENTGSSEARPFSTLLSTSEAGMESSVFSRMSLLYPSSE